MNGKILLQNEKEICVAPNGNGALYQALKDHNII
jgi:UDP-N-acetylglucosamine pyrophosphorylase